MMPTSQRKAWAIRTATATAALGVGLALHASRGSLWFAGVFFGAPALALLGMGRLPEDLPPASDPMRRAHPLYPTYARRGLIASLAMFGLWGFGFFLTARYVRV
jgi:hypothetical protein